MKIKIENPFIFTSKYGSFSVRRKKDKYLIYYTKCYEYDKSFYEQGDYSCVKQDIVFDDPDDAVDYCRIKEKEEYPDL